MAHKKALCAVYPFSEVKRFVVDISKIDWEVQYKEYNPPDYTSSTVMKKPIWADEDINEKSRKFAFNKNDGKVDRRSYNGLYKMSEDGRPLNPKGRTGLKGRGVLGKWGPNHAADPIVTRWKRDNFGEFVRNSKTKKKILQFISIKRRDNSEWAIPGGIVDNGENVSLTLKREFSEEALNHIEMNQHERSKVNDLINQLFASGQTIFKGYADDPRNTDNAWMETIAVNFHDEDGSSVALLPLSAGDDAGDVAWVDISSQLNLYADHVSYLEDVAKLRLSDW